MRLKLKLCDQAVDPVVVSSSDIEGIIDFCN